LVAGGDFLGRIADAVTDLFITEVLNATQESL
jgi:hypothetical protein